jgi:hypothetical protein
VPSHSDAIGGSILLEAVPKDNRTTDGDDHKNGLAHHGAPGPAKSRDDGKSRRLERNNNSVHNARSWLKPLFGHSTRAPTA